MQPTLLPTIKLFIKRKCFFVLCFLSVTALTSYAQDDSLMNALETEQAKVVERVTGAFKSTRVINNHSMEMLAPGNLDVRILHRFGYINNGIDEFFGLDDAAMRMGFDYGITKDLNIGVGRSTFRKELDAFLKYRIWQQSTGIKNIPFSVILLQGISTWTEKSFTGKVSVENRTAYYTQLIIGRKFSDKFSLQLMPTYLHRNMAFETGYNKANIALGLGSRIKVSKRMALTLDYTHSFTDLPDNYYNALSLGIDIETGGHVFQMHFSNASGMNERAFITETTGDFFKGDIRFGFNLSRVFSLKKKRSTKL
jgi:hypothetical protein